MKKIIMDTNALMAIAEFKIDLFTVLEKLDFKYNVMVLSGTIEELNKIMEKQRGKYKRAAKLVLSILQQKKVPILKSQGTVDDLLVKYSQQGYLVLTQDSALKKRLQKPYLTIRQKKKIMVVD